MRSSAGVVLAGTAGVGKTWLAREALAGRGARWVLGTASARSIPLGAFGGLVDTSGGDPALVVRRAVDALKSTVVGVDDAHLLDELSATVVHQLVVRKAATVVVTLRTGEPAPDAVTALWKDEHLTRLELGALSEVDSTALLEAVLDGPVDSAAAARLWALTGGNALFLRHLVDGELAAGRLSPAEGVWQWSGHPAVSGELAEIVRGQMGELPERVRDVVDLLALGEPLAVGVLAELAGAVEEAESRGLVRLDDSWSVRLAHPLYGEVRAAELGRLRARRLRGLLAQRTDDPLRRAVLWLDSDLAPDPALFLAAARAALGLSQLALTERLARAAGGGFAARLTLAYALTWLSRGEEADRVLAELGDDPSVALPRAGNLFWTLARADEAQAVLDAIPAQELDVVRAMRVAFDASLGRPRQALAAGTALVDSPDDQAVVLAAYHVDPAEDRPGRAHAARRALDGLAVAARRRHDYPRGRARPRPRPRRGRHPARAHRVHLRGHRARPLLRRHHRQRRGPVLRRLRAQRPARPPVGGGRAAGGRRRRAPRPDPRRPGGDAMKSALVTGAGRGLGRATALRLAANGWDVYAGVRDEVAGKALAAESPRITPVHLDITDPAHRARLVDLPRLDALVNNAGYAVGGPVEAVALADVRQQFEVNVVGQVAVTQAVLPLLRKSRGRVVFISSLNGRVAIPMSGIYNASKFAVESLADNLRVELRPWGIRVVLIEPGCHDTDPWRNIFTLLDDVAAAMTPAQRDLYAGHLAAQRKLIGKLQAQVKPPDNVAATVERALTARCPRPRMLVGPDARTLVTMKKLLPTRALDSVWARNLGLPSAN